MRRFGEWNAERRILKEWKKEQRRIKNKRMEIGEENKE